jgi:hypothetical protein
MASRRPDWTIIDSHPGCLIRCFNDAFSPEWRMHMGRFFYRGAVATEAIGRSGSRNSPWRRRQDAARIASDGRSPPATHRGGQRAAEGYTRGLSMKWLFVLFTIASLTSMAPAAAQQNQVLTPTCSGFRDRCDQNCSGVRSVGRCTMNCDAKVNLCMQSGTWQEPNGRSWQLERR